MEPPTPKPQAASASHMNPTISTSSTVSAPARGQRRRRGGRGGGRGRGAGGFGRGSEHQQQLNSHSQPISHDGGGQLPLNVDGEASNKRNNNGRRRPRRNGRGGGGVGRGNDNTAVDNDTTINGRRSNDTNTNSAVVESTVESPSSPRTEQAMAFIADSLAGSNDATANDGKSRQDNQGAKQRSKKKGKNKGNPTKPETNSNSQQQRQTDAEKKKKKRSRNRNRKKNNNDPKSYLWREFVPPGLEDPISLQPLVDLTYPPFAVVVDPPYVPILPEMWPPPPLEPTLLPSTSDENNNGGEIRKTPTPANNDKDRELAILKEQWGDHGVAMHSSKEDGEKKDIANNLPQPDNTAETTTGSSNNIQNRHLNLFDGRVLAYYLVSTLQFIDPLTRRDLTRPELLALDAYLSYHRLGNAGVTEAYDAKGVTVSTAGRAAQSAQGRAEILQQEARAILSSFQMGQSQSSRQLPHQQQRARERRDVRQVQSLGNLREEEEQQEEEEETLNSFQQMYVAQEGSRGSRNNRNVPASSHVPMLQHDTGIYEGEGGGGFLLIDDDINPGLRSGIPPGGSNHHDAATTGHTFHSARHIAEMHSQEAQAREGNFPSLPDGTVAADAPGTNHNAVAKRAPLPPAAGGPFKSLSKISKLVKKTDPKEVERQRKAREEAKRRAELSRLSFFNPDMPATAGGIMANNNMLSANTTAMAVRMPPSEAVIERNRNLAMALGVAPSTIRNSEPTLTTGWARPVTTTSAVSFSDEFGNELLNNAAQYPDSLLTEAKERMTELLKLEKQWKKFLADDKSPGYSLKAMDRLLRKFVHECSEFWRLKTESFDPEGRRYIHCSKLVDTSAPYPLLSEAARKWRGPGPSNAIAASPGIVDMMTIPTGPSLKSSLVTSLPTALPSSSSSDGWRTEQRVPLKLTPRTAIIVPMESGDNTQPPQLAASANGGGMTRSTSTPLLSMTNERPPPPRFADLCDKERPRLQLAPRSIPTWDELEKQHNTTQEEWNAMPLDRQEAILCEMEEEEDRNRARLEREKEKEDARVYRLENKAVKKRVLMEKQRAILESAFASSDDDGGSSSSDWFEGDLEFDGSDDEGM